MSSNHPSSAARSFTARLNREWEQLRLDAAGWLSPAVPLDEVLRSVAEDPDASLGGVIAACQQGHGLAGRVVVQALLPKLVLLSRQYPYPTVDSLVSALWVRVASFPLDRRPNAVAANLVLDAKKDALAEARATASPIEPVVAATTPTADAVIAAARRLGLATPMTAAIMELVYVKGLPGEEVARLHSISCAAVRRRCADVVQRLRANRSALIELTIV